VFNSCKEILVFDFDGVIVESNQIKYDTFFNIWEGYSVQNKVRESLLIGGDRRQVISRVYNDLNMKLDLDYALDFFVDMYSRLVHEEVMKIGVSQEVIRFLDQDKRIKFINSATPQVELRALCDDLGISEYFHGIFGAPRTKGDNFNIICKENKVKVEQLVFFGDMQSDKSVAKEVNVEFCPIFSKGTDLDS